jgi:hypothetical protein
MRKEQFSGFGEVKGNRLLALRVAFDANARGIGDKCDQHPTLHPARYKDIFMSSEIPTTEVDGDEPDQ